MIIIKLHGGLGNQMFQYALYERLAGEGKDVYLDPVFPSLLKSVFGLSPRYAAQEDTLRLYKPWGNRVLRFIRYRVLGIPLRRHYNRDIYVYEPKTDAFLGSGGGAYLEGYWQNERWFASAESAVRAAFTFPEPTGERLRLAEAAASPGAVAVHVRLYASENPEWASGDLPPGYYDAAVKYFQERLENPTFYVFSYDLAGARALLRLPNAVFVDIPDEAWNDMASMSLFRNIVIANSSYAWWAAYLNPLGHDKRCVAPADWMSTKSTPNREGWASL